MKDHHVILTETDRAILESYSAMLEGLSMYLGEGYELVLHSLEDYSSSAVKVIHGLHTGRTEGAPLTDLALDLLEEMQKEDADSRGITYFTHNKKGEPLKSVTIPVRGEKDRIIGLLCINFYLNTPFSEYISNFVACGLKPQEQYENRKENFSSSSVELLEDMAEEIRREVIEEKSERRLQHERCSRQDCGDPWDQQEYGVSAFEESGAGIEQEAAWQRKNFMQ